MGEQAKTIEYRFGDARPHEARSMTSRVYRGEADDYAPAEGNEKSHPRNQIRNSRLIQPYRPTVFFLSLNISRKSLIYKGLFVFLVHLGICGAYILCFGCPKMQRWNRKQLIAKNKRTVCQLIHRSFANYCLSNRKRYCKG